MSSQSVSISVPIDLTSQYDALALATGQTRDHLIVQVLRDFLVSEQDDLRRIREAIGQAERGEVVEEESLAEELAVWLEERGVRRAEQDAIGKEAAAEFQAYYGIAALARSC